MTAIAYPSHYAAPTQPAWGSLASPWTRNGEAKAATVDYFAIIGWIAATTFIMVPLFWPVRYGLLAFFLFGMFRYWRTLLPMAGRNFIFFLIPFLAVLSAIWAPSPPDAIRKGFLLAMTTVAAIYMAGRLHPKQIIKAYFWVEVVVEICCLVHPGIEGGVAIGIFNQKNVLAGNMFYLFVAAMAIALDPEETPLMRIFAALQLPGAMALLILAKSATMLGFTVVAMVAYLAQAVVWGPAKQIPHLRTLMALVGCVFGMVVAIIVFGVMQIDAKEALLGALGKDSSLTGRTYLWAQARTIMHDKPWTGVGANGFWLPWRGEANSITQYFHFKTFTPFNFHNSYLELGVMFGYPGMYAGILVVAWAVFNNFRRFLFDQSFANFFFIAMGGMAAIHTNTEIDLPTEFGGTLIILMVAAMLPLRRQFAPELLAAPPEPSTPTAAPERP